MNPTSHLGDLAQLEHQHVLLWALIVIIFDHKLFTIMIYLILRFDSAVICRYLPCEQHQ